MGLLIFIKKIIGVEIEQMDIQQIIFQFIGGLGIFLFGIKAMGEGSKVCW